MRLALVVPWGLFPWQLRCGVYALWLLLVLHLVDLAVRARRGR